MAAKNPALVVFGNPVKGPPRGMTISESRAWDATRDLASEGLEALDVDHHMVARHKLEQIRQLAMDMFYQVAQGVHANPKGWKKIGRHVQAIVYINDKDGGEYVHGFGGVDPDEADLEEGVLKLDELAKNTNVEAFYSPDKKTVMLRHKHGKALTGLFPD